MPSILLSVNLHITDLVYEIYSHFEYIHVVLNCLDTMTIIVSQCKKISDNGIACSVITVMRMSCTSLNGFWIGNRSVNPTISFLVDI